MGAFLEGLDDHEGYALRRLADGTLTGVGTGATLAFTAYLPVCGCGWRSPHQHPPTEQGWEAAVEAWRAEHAVPLLAQQADRRRQELARVLGWLGDQAGRLHDPGQPGARPPRDRPRPPAGRGPPARPGPSGLRAGDRRWALTGPIPAATAPARSVRTATRASDRPTPAGQQLGRCRRWTG
jgi:hypothetical protein